MRFRGILLRTIISGTCIESPFTRLGFRTFYQLFKLSRLELSQSSGNTRDVGQNIQVTMRKLKLIIPVMFRHIGRPSAGISLRHVSWHTYPIYFGSVKNIYNHLWTLSRAYSTHPFFFSLFAYMLDTVVKVSKLDIMEPNTCMLDEYVKRMGTEEAKMGERRRGWAAFRRRTPRVKDRSVSADLSVRSRFRGDSGFSCRGPRPEQARKRGPRAYLDPATHRSGPLPRSPDRTYVCMCVYVCRYIHTHIKPDISAEGG